MSSAKQKNFFFGSKFSLGDEKKNQQNVTIILFSQLNIQLTCNIFVMFNLTVKLK